MARHRRVGVAAAALLVASLTACGGAGGGDNSPTTPPTVSFPADPNKAPSVPDPIRPESFIEEPCTSLTPEQQRKYNLDSGESGPTAVGEECIYNHTNDDRWIQIEYSNRGLQNLYEGGPQSDNRWKPEVLDGYPAVATDRVDRIGVPSYDLSCYYAVGVNDSLYVAVLDADSGTQCANAKKIAADVLANIKEHR